MPSSPSPLGQLNLLIPLRRRGKGRRRPSNCSLKNDVLKPDLLMSDSDLAYASRGGKKKKGDKLPEEKGGGSARVPPQNWVSRAGEVVRSLFPCATKGRKREKGVSSDSIPSVELPDDLVNTGKKRARTGKGGKGKKGTRLPLSFLA